MSCSIRGSENRVGRKPFAEERDAEDVRETLDRFALLA
jgi:hypothetical protein